MKKRRIKIIGLTLSVLLIAAIAFAAFSPRQDALITGIWRFQHKTIFLDSNPFEFEGATSDGYETSVVVTDPTADRTITIPDADVNLGAFANNLLAAPYSYFTVALHHEGQETATLDPAATFQMPFAATLVEVSVCARNIDTVDTNETYTVDLEEAGTTVLSSAVAITADNTPVVGTISDSAIADNAKMEVVLTLGGTTPAIDDLTVLLTFKVAHTS